MSNWYKQIKEANKEEFLVKQKPKNLSMAFWVDSVRWAIKLSKKHAVWLTNMIKINKEVFNQGEDDEMIKEVLKLFEKAKKRPEFAKKDINEFKSYEELQIAVEPYKEVKTNKEQEMENVKNGLRFIDKHEEYSLFEVLDEKAASIVADGTSWCVVHEHHFKSYHSRGPIFFIGRGKNPYCLMAYDSNEFKNKHNSVMSPGEIVPIVPLIERNKKELSLPESPDPNKTEFKNILSAIKEIKSMREDYPKMTFDEFVDSPAMEYMAVSMSDHSDSDMSVWEKPGIMFSLKDDFPKEFLDHVIAIGAKYTIRKISQRLPKIYSLIQNNNLYDLQIETKKAGALYDELPLPIKKAQGVWDAYNQYFEQVIVNFVKYTPSQEELMEEIEDAPKIEGADISSRYGNMLQYRLLSLYSRVPNDFKRGEILSHSRALIQKATNLLYKDGEDLRTLIGDQLTPAHNYQRIPKELVNDKLEEYTVQDWVDRIKRNPWSYQGVQYQQSEDIYGTYVEERESVTIRLPDHMRKKLKPVVTEAFNKMFDSGPVTYKDHWNDIEKTTLNEFTAALEHSLRSISDIPEFIQKTKPFQESVTYYLNNLIKYQKALYDDKIKEEVNFDYRSPYSMNNEAMLEILESVNPSALTPEIYEGFKGLLYEIGYNNNYPEDLIKLSEKLRKIPGLEQAMGSGFIDGMDYDLMSLVTFMDNDHNNISHHIPDYIRESTAFKEKVTKLSLEMIRTNHRVSGEYSVPYEGSGIASIKDYIPDYVAADPAFEDVYDEALIRSYRENYYYLMNYKIRQTDRLEGLKDVVKNIRERFEEREDLDDPDTWMKEHSSDLLRTIKELETMTAPFDRPKVQEFWEGEALPKMYELLEKENSIFYAGDKPIRGEISNEEWSILYAFNRWAKELPDIAERLREIYEKDKNKINIENFNQIKPVYKELPDIDLLDRIGKMIVSKLTQKVQEHDNVMRPYLDEYIILKAKSSNLRQEYNKHSSTYRWGRDGLPEDEQNRLRQIVHTLHQKWLYYENMIKELARTIDVPRNNQFERDETLNGLIRFFDIDSRQRRQTHMAAQGAIEEYNEKLAQEIEQKLYPLLISDLDPSTKEAAKREVQYVFNMKRRSDIA